MKTAFMQQIIAIAIFSASILRTSGTPLPASLLPARDTLAPFLPIDVQRVADLASYPREALEGVSSTELDGPQVDLIAPRADYGPAPGSIHAIMDVLSNEIGQHHMASHEPELVPFWQSPNRLQSFLETVVEGYRGLARNQNEAFFPYLRNQVAEAVTLSCQDLSRAFSNQAEAKITEETGTPLIEHLIQMADLSIYNAQTVAGHDLADVVLLAVRKIKSHGLKWPIIIGGLDKAQTDLENKSQRRMEGKQRTSISDQEGWGHA